MDFTKFNTQCLGITVENWPHPQVGIFTYVDDEWGFLSPVPETDPLFKQVKCVDSDIYFRFKDLKLVKIIKYVEQKQVSTGDKFPGYNGNDTGKSSK